MQTLFPSPRIHQGKASVYTHQTIRERSTSRFRTHSSWFSDVIFRSGQFLAAPALNAARAIISFKEYGGAAGADRKVELLKAAGYVSLSLLLLPAVLAGASAMVALRPGRGDDRVRFFDGSKKGVLAFSDQGYLHFMTYNVAGLPTPSDAIKDVPPPKDRMREWVKWVKAQKEEDLPLVMGFQESFNMDAARVLTNGLASRYPYAVTSSGRAETPAVGSNSGLEIHSRVPITSAAFFPFQDLEGFGVRASDRGVLRVELDVGGGKTAMIYVTHTQPHVEFAEIRMAELALLRAQMRADRLNDLNEGIDRQGHYYLMGDLNVANIDDESLLRSDEYNDRRGVIRQRVGGQEVLVERKVPALHEVLHRRHFYDPYLEDHDVDGNRLQGAPQFLRRDEEPKGSFYLGLERKSRKEGEWGTSSFSRGLRPVVEGCRLDYILRLEDLEDFDLGPGDISAHGFSTGRAEIRRIPAQRFPRAALSDHLPVSAIFPK